MFVLWIIRQVKLMVWGCSWGNQRDPLVPLVNGMLSPPVSRVPRTRLLRRWLLPVVEDARASLGNPLFQQDDAEVHTTKPMLSFFKHYDLSRVSSTVPPTLIQSSMLGFYLNHKSEPSILVKSRLMEILPLCWENIPPKQFEALWNLHRASSGSHRCKGMSHSLLVVLGGFFWFHSILSIGICLMYPNTGFKEL